MPLRDGIEHHWVSIGKPYYVGRRHAGGVVVTGPMYLEEAVATAQRIREEGHQAEISNETATIAAWFRITVLLNEV